MTFTLTRHAPGTHSTLGDLTLEGSYFHLYTLEPGTDRVDFPRIPTGTYEVIMRESAKQGCRVPGLVNVPGRTDIEMHIGNYPHDTLGCQLVGYTLGADYVGVSRPAFGALVALIEGAEAHAERVFLTITEPEAP